MNSPLVSIVIPCHNAEAYVGEAVRSALDQTYPRVEVIAVDDGSTDGSLEVIRSFGDRVRWETGPNRGACAARNRGVELAKGQLIQFLDADDLLYPHKVEVQLQAVLQHKEAIVYCNWHARMRDGEEKHVVPICDGMDPVAFALLGFVQTSAPIHWKARLISIGGFREHLPCSQERDLHLRLACAEYRFVHLNETLYFVRQRYGSVSDNWMKVLDQRYRIVLEAHRTLLERHELNEQRARAFAQFLARDARSYFHLGNIRKCHRNFRKAREIHPGGGLDAVYPSRMRRALHRLFGPVGFQRLVDFKRAVVPK
jgi:glycosyltransferase involved in cell wall biosynthesis